MGKRVKVEWEYEFRWGIWVFVGNTGLGGEEGKGGEWNMGLGGE